MAAPGSGGGGGETGTGSEGRMRTNVLPLPEADRAAVRERIAAIFDNSGSEAFKGCVRSDEDKAVDEGDISLAAYLPTFVADILEKVGPQLSDEDAAVFLQVLLEQRYGRL